MKQRTTLKLAVYVFGALFCCNVGFTQSTAENSLDNEKKIIGQMNEQYFAAIQHNDPDSFCSQYSPDCWIMTPGVPVYCGPDAAQEYFADLVEKRKATYGKFITINLYGTKKGMLTEIGFYQLYNSVNEQFDDGTYIVLWEKTITGWKRLTESRNSSRTQYGCM